MAAKNGYACFYDIMKNKIYKFSYSWSGGQIEEQVPRLPCAKGAVCAAD